MIVRLDGCFRLEVINPGRVTKYIKDAFQPHSQSRIGCQEQPGQTRICLFVFSSHLACSSYMHAPFGLKKQIASLTSLDAGDAIQSTETSNAKCEKVNPLALTFQPHASFSFGELPGGRGHFFV
jgi:hypothetical protein